MQELFVKKPSFPDVFLWPQTDPCFGYIQPSTAGSKVCSGEAHQLALMALATELLDIYEAYILDGQSRSACVLISWPNDHQNRVGYIGKHCFLQR